MSKNEDTHFDWQFPKIIASLPKGNYAEPLYKAIKENEKLFGGNDRVKYTLGFMDYKLGEIRGSSPLRTGQIYYLIKDFGIRVAVPRDDVHGAIFNLIDGKFYSDFNVLVVQKEKPNNERNNGLWKKVIELAETTKGTVKYPFMIQGFYVLPDNSEIDYGVKIVPAPNFEVIEDDRFSVKYNGWKFNLRDKDGIPADLNQFNGKFTFLTREDGLS